MFEVITKELNVASIHHPDPETGAVNVEINMKVCLVNLRVIQHAGQSQRIETNTYHTNTNHCHILNGSFATQSGYIQITLAYVATILGLSQWSWPSTTPWLKGSANYQWWNWFQRKVTNQIRRLREILLMILVCLTKSNSLGIPLHLWVARWQWSLLEWAQRCLHWPKNKKRQRRTRNGPWRMQSICWNECTFGMVIHCGSHTVQRLRFCMATCDDHVSI